MPLVTAEPPTFALILLWTKEILKIAEIIEHTVIGVTIHERKKASFYLGMVEEVPHIYPLKGVKSCARRTV